MTRAPRVAIAASLGAAIAGAAIAIGCNLIADIEAGEPLDDVTPEASIDASSDAPPESAPPKCTGSTCTIGGKKSLCQNGACAPCKDAIDDKVCATAYPTDGGPTSICDHGECKAGTCTTDVQCTGFPEVCSGGRCVLCANDGDCGSGRLCVAGLCADGDCRTNADCGGKLCVAYRCMPCTSDRACERLNPAAGAPMSCDHMQGTCKSLPAACATGDTMLGHVCCADGWHFGECCSSATCSAPTATCADHVCSTTACDAPVADASNNLTYFVDPASAVAKPTGTAACPMKTLTQALRVAPIAPAGTRVIFSVTPVALSGAEAWPLYLDAQLVASPGAATFTVPSSAIAGIVLVGDDAFAQGASAQGSGSRMGIVAASGTSKAWFVDATRFVDGFVVAPEATLVLDKASFAGDNTRYGALVWGFLDLHELSNDGHRYMRNSSAGIAVFGMGYAHMTGSFMSPVFVQQNTGDGVLLWTSPASTNPTTIDTLSITGNRNGLVVAGGAHVSVRRTIIQGNSGSGVLVRPYRASTGASNDLSAINLGDQTIPPNLALNTLQGTGSKNAGAGICLASSPNAGTLLAKGNVFGATDCADGGVLTTSTSCDAGADLAITSTAGNKIAVDLCTAQ